MAGNLCDSAYYKYWERETTITRFTFLLKSEAIDRIRSAETVDNRKNVFVGLVEIFIVSVELLCLLAV